MIAIWTFLQHNQLVQGGLFLGMVGAVLAYFRQVPIALYQAIKNRMLYSFTVTSDEAAYYWLEYWVFTKFTKLPRIRSFRLVTRINYSSGERERITALIPAPGQYVIQHNGIWLWISTEIEKLEKAGTDELFLKTITIRALRGDRPKMEALIAEAEELSLNLFKNKLHIYTCGPHGDWVDQMVRNPRPLASVILANDLATTLATELKQFKERKEWYVERGVPYRRGYLLYGEPGNGKTSLVVALATELRQNVAVLSLSSFGMSDEKLNSLLTNLPDNCIVCIEDIDAAFSHRQKDADNKSGLSFSGLLNALDGIASGEERILFMTTNFKERLDPALIRAGRADSHVYLGNANKEQARQMFLRFFPDSAILAERFTCSYVDGSMSMASLQEKFLSCATPEEAVG